MTYIVTNTLDVVAIHRQLHGREGGVYRDMLRRGLRVQTMAKRLAPVDTGRLRQSIALGSEPRVVEGESTIAIVVGTDLEYAAAVHRGTGIFGPHHTPITPKRGKLLVFEVGGPGRGGQRLVVARSVRGQPGRPFLKDALKAVVG